MGQGAGEVVAEVLLRPVGVSGRDGFYDPCVVLEDILRLAGGRQV